MARIGYLHVFLILAINSRSSLWMYCQAFHPKFFVKQRVVVIQSQYNGAKVQEEFKESAARTLRMSKIDPTNTDKLLKYEINGTASLPIQNDKYNSGMKGVLQNEDITPTDTKKTAFTQSIQQPPPPPPQQQQSIRSPKKYHHLSVCMVPPESSVEVWEAITKCRIQFKDPGLYRWPPHANLLYPFIDVQQQPATIVSLSSCNNSHEDSDDTATSAVDPTIIESLLHACRQIEPFNVKLHQFGTFGSSKRGVLWLFPDSYKTYSSPDDDIIPTATDESDVDYKSPLVQLQELLVESFPYCNDQNLKSNEGFNPHMTISHFINHQDALEAQTQVESWWLSPISDDRNKATSLHFPVEYIYLLQRFGDSGQFLRVADIPLGTSSEVIVHPTPVPFLHMPTEEADGVYQERMKLKQRRNGQWRSRGGGSSSKPSRSRNNVTDTAFLVVDDAMNTTTTIAYK